MFTKVWLLSTGERLVKSFAQGYVAFWLMSSGLGNGPVDNISPSMGAYDLFFTMDNLKAGVLMAALSLLTSLGSTPLGPDKASPSLTVSENPPTVADTGVV